MAEEVLIVGIGQTPVEEQWEVSLRELGWLAMRAALEDSGGLRPQALFVGNMLAPQLSRQAHLGALMADFAGLTGIEAVTIEAGEASGGAALRAGYLAVASGMVEVALVLGVEKFSDTIGPEVEAALTTQQDSDYEAVQGLTPTAQAALLMRRYLHEYAIPRPALGGFPLIAHANAATNPNAMFRKPISLEMYQQAALISEPLNLFDAAPYADGAAALVLARRSALPRLFPKRLVRIAASSLVTDTLALHDRPDPLAFQAASLSVARALRKAGLQREDIDFFEVHDAFSIYAALSLEAAGFAPRGQGWTLAQNGSQAAAVGLQGSLPICTLGGLKARGHAGGASGVYQAVEAVIQLRGQGGPNQVSHARRALIQNLAGPATSAVTHILEALD